MDKNNIKWGIISTGKIANKFVADLKLVDSGSAYAVASRSLEKAEAFCKKYQMAKAFGSYAELINDPQVDIIYIGTPHDSHSSIAIACLEAGKPVLCEKPLGVNAGQVQSIINASVKSKTFMMEAFWARFNPTIQRSFELIQSGAIGDVNYINADFSFARNDADESRMLNKSLAGGALLDMGVYPIFLAYLVFGNPIDIKAISRFYKTGVDIQTGILLKFQNGIANLMTGFVSKSDMTAKIYGSNGHIYINPNWHHSEGLELKSGDQITNEVHPTKGMGYTYEIEECHKCLSNTQIQSDLWSHQNSLDLISITDEIRTQVGLKYPFE